MNIPIIKHNKILYGKNKITIKDKADKVIFDYWVNSRMYEDNDTLRLDFTEDIINHNGETLTLGVFKQSDNEEEIEEIKKQFNNIFNE